MALTTTQKLELGQLLTHRLRENERNIGGPPSQQAFLDAFLDRLSEADQEAAYDEMLDEQIAAVTKQRDDNATQLNGNLDVLNDKKRDR